MSELKLSAGLIEAVRRLISEYDKQAQHPGVCAQYLAAVIGCLIADTHMEHQDKRKLVQELFSFAARVVDDLEHRQPLAPDQAYGKWRPGDS